MSATVGLCRCTCVCVYLHTFKGLAWGALVWLAHHYLVTLLLVPCALCPFAWAYNFKIISRTHLESQRKRHDSTSVPLLKLRMSCSTCIQNLAGISSHTAHFTQATQHTSLKPHSTLHIHLVTNIHMYVHCLHMYFWYQPVGNSSLLLLPYLPSPPSYCSTPSPGSHSTMRSR